MIWSGGVFWNWSRQLDLLERSSSIQSEIQPLVVGQQPMVVGQQPMVVNPVYAKTGKYWILAVGTIEC